MRDFVSPILFVVGLIAASSACNNAPPAAGGADAIAVPGDTASSDASGDAATADASDATTDRDGAAPDTPGADGGPDTAMDAEPADVGPGDTADDVCAPAAEVCNGRDDDCDGVIDEDLGLGGACTVGVGRCVRAGRQVCTADGTVTCSVRPGRPDLEVCDGVDDDCDEVVDEGCAACGTVAREIRLPDDVAAGAITGVAVDGATTWVAVGDRLARVDADGAVATRSVGLGATGARFGLAVGPRGELLALGDAADAGLVVSTLDDVGVRARDVLTPVAVDQARFDVDDDVLAVAWTADGTSRVATRDLSGPDPVAAVPEVDVGSGTVVGVAVADTRVTVALSAPSRLVAIDAGRPSWDLDLAAAGLDVAAVDDDGERLVVAGVSAGGVRVATVDRRTGALAWQAVVDDPAGASVDAVSLADDGTIRVAYDGVFDGDASARVVRVEPGVGRTGWAAGWRYTRTIGFAGSSADGVVHVGGYDGPTPAAVMVRRLHRPCDAERGGDRVRTWVLSGQSNMVGYGRVDQLPADLAAPFDAVDLYWDQSRRITPVGPASIGGLFGPEVSFARDVALAYPNERLMLVKYAVGGTNLYSQWAPGESADDPFRGGLYRIWQQTLADAIAANAARGLETDVAGMAWMQGESDGFDEANAIAYAANLTRFVRRTRDDLGATRTLPFAIGRIFAPTVTWREVVRAGQHHVADTVHGAAIVDTDDLPLGDVIHYDTGGTLTLGRRLAAAVLHASDVGDRTLAPPREPADVVDEAAAYTLVADLDVPSEGFWLREADVRYTVDRRAELAGVPFDRVAWWVELDARDRDRRAVWVSAEVDVPMAALGLPVDVASEVVLADVNVRFVDDEGGAVDGVAGRLEAWSACYNPGGDGLFDAFDVPFGGDCYGSLQVHAALGGGAPALSPVFAFNRWATAQDGLDLGIGASPVRHPDWTFTRAARGWEVRRVAFFVRPAE